MRLEQIVIQDLLVEGERDEKGCNIWNRDRKKLEYVMKKIEEFTCLSDRFADSS